MGRGQPVTRRRRVALALVSAVLVASPFALTGIAAAEPDTGQTTDTTQPADTPPETPADTPPADTPPADTPPADTPPATDTAAASTATGDACAQQGTETVATDAPDYVPESTVHVTGSGYASSCDVTVRVTRPDGSVVLGDGSFAPGSDSVTTSASGAFAYDYQLDGIQGMYTIDVLGVAADAPADDTATADTVLATMQFADSDCLAIQATLIGTTCHYLSGTTAIGTDITATLNSGLSVQFDTGATVTLAAGVDYNVTTPADAAAGIVFQSGSSLANLALAGAPPTVTLTALGGPITHGGSISLLRGAGSSCPTSVSLAASAVTTQVGSTIATSATASCNGGAVSITSGGATTLSGSINTGTSGTNGARVGGSVTVSSSGALSIPGAITTDSSLVSCSIATGAVSLSGASVTIGGSVSAQGTNGGSNSCAGGTIGITTGGTVSVAGTVSSASGSTNGGPITMTVGGNAQLDGTVTSTTGGASAQGGAITVNAGGNIALGTNAQVVANNTRSGGCNAPAAGGAVTLNAGGAVSIGVSADVTSNAVCGNGGDIAITSGGDTSILTTAVVSATAGSSKTGGDITIIVGGNMSLATGATISVNSGGTAGSITVSAPNGTITFDGSVLSQGGATGQSPTQPAGGGPITAIAGCALSVGGTVSSSGADPGADLVHLEGCDVNITGTVESTGAGHALPANHCNTAGHPSGSTACIEIVAHGNLTITGTINADLSLGASQRSWIDLTSRGALSITGGAGFAVHANNGGNTPTGGAIAVYSALGSTTLAGNAVQANASGSNGGGGKGGAVSIGAGGTNVSFGTAVVQATGNTSGSGGSITGRSYNGTVTGTAPGALNASGGSPANGVVTLQACTATPTYTGTVTPAPFVNPGNQCGNAPMSDFAACTGCVGSLNVTKSVVGTAPVGTTFTIKVDCTRDEFDRTLTFSATGVLTGGGPLPITGIPANTQCTVTETGTGGASSVSYSPGGSSPPTVTIAAAQASTVTVTNSYFGKLNLAKVLQGTAPVGTTFTIKVDCTVDSFDATFTFDATGTLVPPPSLPITGIPVGTQCTVTETGTGGASTVAYDPHGATAQDPPTVTITASETPVTVTVTNSFLGSLDLDKVVVGNAPDGTTFTIKVDCTDDSFDKTFTFDATGTLVPPPSLPITGIPVGTQCTVTETADGGASPVAYDPHGATAQDPPTVTITASETPVTVTVTNSFLGKLKVNKVVVGDAPDGTVFTINVSCPSASVNVDLTFDATGALDPDTQTNPITGIPVGTECTVTETGTGGASSVTYSPDPPTVTITAGETPVSVTVTNSFLGSLKVNKVVSGNAPDGTVFTINVTCASAGIDVDLTFDATGALDPDTQTNPITGIPVGTECTVHETDDGGASAVDYSPNPPTVTIVAGETPVSVTVTNLYFGGLEVDKVVVGDAPAATVFTINVSCPSASIDTNLTFDADGNLDPDTQTNPIPEIPVGTECTVTETGTGGASPVVYEPHGATENDPPTVTIVQGPTPITVTVTNSFLGSLKVNKVVSGNAPDGTVFTINVSCPDAGVDVDLTFDATGALDPDTQTNPITGIPVGTECTVHETDDGGASAVDYSPNPPTVTIVAGETPVSVTVTNVYFGGLEVDKVVAGEPAPGATFTINVSCPSASINTNLTFDADGNLDPNTQTNPIPEIPVGTQCTVTETGTGGADGVAYDPHGATAQDPPTVTITQGPTPVTVTVTNTFSDVRSFGDITVGKIISPSGGTATIGDQYGVRVQCFDDAAPPNEVYDQTTTLVFDTTMSHTFNSIPLPASCTVTEESLPAEAALVAYLPNGGTPTTPPTIPLTVEDNSASVAITNSYTNVGGDFSGKVSIQKQITGLPPAQGTQFVVHVHCTGPTVAVDQDVTLTYSTVLTGSVSFQAPTDETVTCTVTEKDPLGGAVSATIGPNNGIVVLTVNAPSADVTVTNHYGDPGVEVGGISVTALPFTGSPVAILVKVALWLLAIGLVTLLAARTRRRRDPLGG